MGRKPTRAGGRYIPPLQTDGTELTAQTGVGIYTLVAGTTYLYIIGGDDAPFQSVQITGYDAGLVITSATIQDTNHQELEVANKSTTVGEWINERPTTAYVGADGTGWSVGSGATAGVVAASGAGIGGALWHIAETGSARTRLIVVVGATGGKLRVSCNGKD